MIEVMRNPGAPPPPTVKPVETRPVTIPAGLPINYHAAGGRAERCAARHAAALSGEGALRDRRRHVIAPGATVVGEIAGVKKGILGRGGKVMFRLSTATAMDGTQVRVRATAGKNTDRAEHPIEPPGHRDKSLLAPAGSTYTAYIDGEQTVQVKK